jgi:hypothetical protein
MKIKAGVGEHPSRMCRPSYLKPIDFGSGVHGRRVSRYRFVRSGQLRSTFGSLINISYRASLMQFGARCGGKFSFSL